MAEGSLSLESSPGEDQTDLGVIKTLESQVENLKDENETLRRKHNDDKDRQNKVNEELIEKLREDHRREKDGIEKGHKEAIVKVKADCEQKIEASRQEAQEVDKLLMKERMAKETLLIEHQKELTKKSDEFEASKNDLETELRQEITGLRRMVSNEGDERERELAAAKRDSETLKAQLVESESKCEVAKEEKESLEEAMQTMKAALETELKDKTQLEQVIQTKEIEIKDLRTTLSEREKALADGLGQKTTNEWEELREKAEKSEKDLKYWKATAEGLEEERIKWMSTLPTIEENMKRVQAENVTLKLEYENRIDDLGRKHQEEMAAVLAKHEERLHVLTQDAEGTLARVNDELLGELKNEKQGFVKDKEALVVEHATEIEELRTHCEALLAEKDKQQALSEQVSADRLDEREKRLNAESGKTISAREEKIATLEGEIKEKNEQLLTMRDRLNQEYNQSLEVVRMEYKEQRAAMTEEHEKLINDIKRNNEVVSKTLEDRIAELKAALSGSRDEMKSEVARLGKEKEDALAAARNDLQTQRDVFEGRIKQLEDNHATAFELVRQDHAILLENLKEGALQTKADELSRMASDYEMRLDSVLKERESLKRALEEKLNQSLMEIDNLKRSHEEVLMEEQERQKNLRKLLEERAKESSDEMIRFLVEKHSSRDRDLVAELGKAREDANIALDAKDRKCKEKLAVLREEFRVATLQAEERRVQEMNCKALEWGKREGELVQDIESLKAIVAKLEQKHATEESEEIKRLESVVVELETGTERMKKEHETEVGELRAKFLAEKRKYESEAQAERAGNDKKNMDAQLSLVKEVNKLQGKSEQKDQLVETLRAEVRQLQNGSRDTGVLRREQESMIEQLQSDLAAKVEELRAVGRERDRIQSEVEAKELEVSDFNDLVIGLRKEKQLERNRADCALAELQEVKSVLKIEKSVQTEIESASQNGACGSTKKKNAVVKRFSKFFHSKRKPKLKRVNSACTSRRVSRRASLSNERSGEEYVLMNGGPGVDIPDTASLLNRAADGQIVGNIS